MKTVNGFDSSKMTAITLLQVRDDYNPPPNRVSRAEFVRRLMAGRQKMKEQCMEVAEKNTPSGLKLEFGDRLGVKIRPVAEAAVFILPKPYTRNSLYIYLVGCAFYLTRNRYEARHTYRFQKCFEAAKWAEAIMRKAGIAVPQKMVNRMRELVHAWLEKERPKGHVERKIRRFAKRHDL